MKRTIQSARRASLSIHSAPSHQHSFRPAAVAAIPTNLHSTRSFSSSTYRRNEQQAKSPFKVFVDTLRDEIQKNRDLQDNVSRLQGDVTKMQDSEAMKKAQELYERARITASIKENPKLAAAAEELRKTGVVIGDAVAEAVRQVEQSELMRQMAKAAGALGSAAATATAPIRNTAAYKALADSVTEAFDDVGSTSGFEEKEKRRRKRQARLEKLGKAGMGVKDRIKANAEAGDALVMHATASQEPSKWDTLKETNPVFQRLHELRQDYYESESPFVSRVRNVTDTIGSWFEENETAKVARVMKQLDPGFSAERFEKELREYIVPELLDAYLSADKEALQMWTGEAVFTLLWATMAQYHKQGLVSDSKVLDVRHIEVQMGKMLDINATEVPIYLVVFETQEHVLFRNKKTNEVVIGSEGRVEQARYAIAVTRFEDELENEVTGGWKIVELARRAQKSFL